MPHVPDDERTTGKLRFAQSMRVACFAFNEAHFLLLLKIISRIADYHPCHTLAVQGEEVGIPAEEEEERGPTTARSPTLVWPRCRITLVRRFRQGFSTRKMYITDSWMSYDMIMIVSDMV